MAAATFDHDDCARCVIDALVIEAGDPALSESWRNLIDAQEVAR